MNLAVVLSVKLFKKLIPFTSIHKYFVLRLKKKSRPALSETLFDKITANIPQHRHPTRFMREDLLIDTALSVAELLIIFVITHPTSERP